MEHAALLSEIRAITEGALYFSESENPFSVSDWGQVSQETLRDKIASEAGVDPASLKQVDPEYFFQRLSRSTDPDDEVLNQNATKLGKLYPYLQQHLQDIQVSRAEGNSRIPIVITGYTPDQTCIAIQTVAIET